LRDLERFGDRISRARKKRDKREKIMEEDLIL
jgi:hypothetical protein